MTALSSPAPSHGRWDRLGILASAACTVHCVFAPLILLAIPQLAGVWEHPASHAVFALLVLPCAGLVLRNGYRMHGKRWVAVAAVLGMIFIVVGSVFPFLGSQEEAVAEQAGCASGCCPQIIETAEGGSELILPAASILTMIGSFFLVSSHIGNILACRCCRLAAVACGELAELPLTKS